MRLWNSTTAKLQIQITSANLTERLKQLTQQGIIFFDVQSNDDLTAYATIKKGEYKRIQKYLHKCGDQCELSGSMYGIFHHLKRRYVILLGILIMFFLTVYIPSKIFFVKITGNQKISTQYIAEKVIENGIDFGCDRWHIRSAQLKNQILEDIPELDWVGITTAGCVATIEVKEKEMPDNSSKQNFCSIVASVDGLVESVTATRGKALCVPGQAVRTGQLLISGYVDQGFLIKATGAEGEVYAKTFRRLTAVSPATYVYRSEPIDSKINYSLQIGKKIINFSKHSSISPMSCVKMYTKKYITLPGEYILPAAMIREETVYYETNHEIATDDAYVWLASGAKQYLQTQMLAGEILTQSTQQDMENALCVLTGEYLCKEQIGKYKFEENPLNYGENS